MNIAPVTFLLGPALMGAALLIGCDSRVPPDISPKPTTDPAPVDPGGGAVKPRPPNSPAGAGGVDPQRRAGNRWEGGSSVAERRTAADLEWQRRFAECSRLVAQGYGADTRRMPHAIMTWRPMRAGRGPYVLVAHHSPPVAPDAGHKNPLATDQEFEFFDGTFRVKCSPATARPGRPGKLV